MLVHEEQNDKVFYLIHIVLKAPKTFLPGSESISLISPYLRKDL